MRHTSRGTPPPFKLHVHASVAQILRTLKLPVRQPGTQSLDPCRRHGGVMACYALLALLSSSDIYIHLYAAEGRTRRPG